jgi:transcriptional regulator with XRE-family HTH domain
MSINQRFKKILFTLDKSSTSLANDLELRQSTISKTISGATSPSAKILIPLGEKLDISIDWLLFGDGEMFRSKRNSLEVNSTGENDNSNETIRLLKKQIELLNKMVADKDQHIKDKEALIQSLKTQNDG